MNKIADGSEYTTERKRSRETYWLEAEVIVVMTADSPWMVA